MKSALIVIDVQNIFVNAHSRHIPEAIHEHLEHNTYDLVLLTKFVNRKDSNWVKLLNWKKAFSSAETDIHLALQDLVGDENVFIKTSYSIFKADGLAKRLKDEDITKIFLCGIDIDSCVLASAYEAFDLGYEVRVLEELTASHSGKDFENAAHLILKKSIQK